MPSNPNLLVVYFQGLCALVLNHSNPTRASRGRVILVGAGFENDTLNSGENLKIYTQAFGTNVSVCHHHPYLIFSHSQFVQASGNLDHFTLVKPARESTSRELLGFVSLRGKQVRFHPTGGGTLDPDFIVTNDFLRGIIGLPDVDSLRDDVLQGAPQDERILSRVDLEAGRLFAQRRTDMRMFFRRLGEGNPAGVEPQYFSQDAAFYISGRSESVEVEISPIEGNGDRAVLSLDADSRITICNLCRATPHPPAELDFLAYYELLAQPPAIRNRRIPHAPPFDTKTGSACPPTFAGTESF